MSATPRTARHAHRRPFRPVVVVLTLAGLISGAVGTAMLIDPMGTPPSAASARLGYIHANAQGLDVATTPTRTTEADAEAEAAATKADAETAVAREHAPEVTRDDYGATPGPATYIKGGTNHDWAALVLVYGGWPVTEENVTVILRWMRQENGPPDWYRRNNPLNIGAGGFASYPDLPTAARVVANALNSHPGYAKIAASFAKSAKPSVTEYAIWASPWAGGHYAWGDHWHYTPVEKVKAPASAWGR